MLRHTFKEYWPKWSTISMAAPRLSEEQSEDSKSVQAQNSSCVPDEAGDPRPSSSESHHQSHCGNSSGSGLPLTSCLHGRPTCSPGPLPITGGPHHWARPNPKLSKVRQLVLPKTLTNCWTKLNYVLVSLPFLSIEFALSIDKIYLRLAIKASLLDLIPQQIVQLLFPL